MTVSKQLDPRPLPAGDVRAPEACGSSYAELMPRQIGPYRILGELGTGGMATVYLGEDAAGTRYAIKVPLHLQTRDEASVKPLPPLPLALHDAISLAGAHQKRNAALALSAVQALPLPHHPQVYAALRRESVQRAGLAHTLWPGRLERLWPPAQGAPDSATVAARLRTALPAGCEIWLDAAHNPEGAAALSQFLDETRGERPLSILLGVVAGKDAAAMCQPLRAAGQVILTRPPSPRGLDSAQLLPIVSPFLTRPAQLADDFSEALRLAIAQTEPSGLLMIYGSLFLIGAIRSLWHAEPMDPLWVQDPMAVKPSMR